MTELAGMMFTMTSNPQQVREEAWDTVLANDDLVRKICSAWCKRHSELQFDEWIGAAYEGALKAVESFDPTRGMQLGTWMWRVTINHLHHEGLKFSRQTKQLRRHKDGELEVLTSSTPVDWAMPDTGFDPEDPPLTLVEEGFEDSLLEEITEGETLERVFGAIETLPERDQRVLDMYYFEGQTFDQIGRELGLAPSRPREGASAAHQRALKKLRVALEKDASAGPDGGVVREEGQPPSPTSRRGIAAAEGVPA